MARTTLVQKLLLIAFGIALTLLFLALAEGVLAALGIGDDARFDDPYVGFEGTTPLFVRQELDDGREVYATSPAKLQFFNEQSFPVQKSEDTYRVFALGGSTTAGRPYDDRVSFARWLERYLDLAEPGRRHEVVNAGGVSYASYRIALSMQELVAYSPDLFVVYTGHNEFLEERTYRDILQQGPVRTWVRQRLTGWRLAALTRRALARPETKTTVLDDEVRTRLDVWTGLQAYRRDDALRRSIVEHFGSNLERMVRIARAHDVDLIFVEPVSNLKDFSPFKSEHPADLDRVGRDRFGALLAEGRHRLESGDATGALALFEQARAIDADYAELHFRIGRAHFERGDHDAAHRSFVAAKDLDVAPLRAVEDLVDRVAETAARNDVPLIDLPALLEADSRSRFGHSILGNELLLDHVHPDIEVHGLIAERIVEMLAEAGKVSLGPTWSAAARREITERHLADLDREYYARRDLNLAKVLGWAGKLEEAEAPLVRAAAVIEDDADLHLNLGTLWQRTGRYSEAAAELERAVELAPTVPEARFNLGVTYGHLGRLREGIAELEEALRLRPDYAEAHHNLGVLHRQGGDHGAAIASLERALDLRPEAAEVHRALGLALRLAGRHTEAEAALRESLRLAPVSAPVLTELAVGLAREGRLDEAAAELTRALDLDPSYAEAHYNQGLLLARLGLRSEAYAAYRSAIEIDSGHAPAHNNLGILEAERGELDTARQLLERAIELDPDYGEAHLNLGVVHDQAGRGAAAIRAVERAVELRPEDARAHLALAMLYFVQGRGDESLPHFDAARRGGVRIPPEIAEQLERTSAAH